jgi:8-oxo-dGTP diphosphatase
MRHTSDGIGIDHVAIGILRQDDGIVLVQQQGESTPYWVLPGGLVEAGELIINALVREIQEEVGVVVSEVGRLACCSQIDRPQHAMQSVFFIFEVAAWSGTFQSADPDDEILSVDLVSCAEAIKRLEANGGWAGVQGPLLQYLRGEVQAGSMWFYREEAGVQHLVAHLAI